MTICFAAILSAVVEERVDARAGAMLLRPLLAIGIFSLLLWRWTDDLRALCLGAVLSFSRLGPYPPAVSPAEIYRHPLLGNRRGTVRAGKLLEFLDERILFARLDCRAGIRSSTSPRPPPASQS